MENDLCTSGLCSECQVIKCVSHSQSNVVIPGCDCNGALHLKDSGNKIGTLINVDNRSLFLKKMYHRFVTRVDKGNSNIQLTVDQLE